MGQQMHKIKVVTPAGRKLYLELLKHYILNDASIDEWILWDNCRNPDDRIYINQLAKDNPKITILAIDNPDGTNRTINRFFEFCNEDDTFYIRIDDDVVYLPPNFGRDFYQRAIANRDNYIWYSPVVINNAVSTWMLVNSKKISTNAIISCQANDTNGWKNPRFAYALLNGFADIIENNKISELKVENLEVSGSRFSVNCIGFFGENRNKYADVFCPLNLDEEEWISAVLPYKIKKRGLVFGDLNVCHFSFFTQEKHLIQSGIIKRFYKIANLEIDKAQEAKHNKAMKPKLRFVLDSKFNSGKRNLELKFNI
jgi:hypothetical protein